MSESADPAFRFDELIRALLLIWLPSEDTINDLEQLITSERADAMLEGYQRGRQAAAAMVKTEATQ